MSVDVKAITAEVEKHGYFIRNLMAQLEKVIVGQEYMLERLLIGMLSNGHVLIEGVPGLAKTLTINTLAHAVKASFARIQFTPDLLPADLIGTQIYRPGDGTFFNRQGPIFANMILADEINRAPAKVQSALLEAMQEHQVTIGGETFDLPQPFMVMATQNPIEQEGTYPLPEAQIDRFMLKLKITYPSKVEERLILERMSNTNVKHDVEAVISPEEIIETRKVVDSIYVDDAVKDYIVNIVDATRNPGDYGLDIASLISFGASPRATIFLTLGAKAHAFMQGRGFVTPQDVKSIGADVLRHRVIISYEAEAEEKTSDDVVTAILEFVPVP